MAVHVKMCGITSASAAKAVSDSGAHAMGLVFYDKSPRSVAAEQARSIVRSVGGLLNVVALFVNPAQEHVESVLSALPINTLQFHGDESSQFCEQFNRPYIKAVRVAGPDSVALAAEAHPNARALLVDAYVPGVEGGTGQQANWAWLPKNCNHSLILAGGLSPENVASAIAQTGIQSVDVSSGIESAPGEKSPDKIRAFMKGVNGV